MSHHSDPRTALRWTAGVAFALAGANHFRSTGFYVRVVPPAFPARRALVIVSGVAEMVGGVGLLVPRLRRPAGWGLIALLVAVFPANLYMATSTDPAVTMGLSAWIRWARLPLQVVLIAWVEWVSRPSPPRPPNRGFKPVLPTDA